MSHQDRREPLPKDYHFPVHSCGCPSCVSRLTPEHSVPYEHNWRIVGADGRLWAETIKPSSAITVHFTGIGVPAMSSGYLYEQLKRR